MWHATSVYRDLEANNRIEFVNSLSTLDNKRHPWLIIRDINICSSPLDKLGRHGINQHIALAYHKFLFDYELEKIPFKVNRFTWSNK